MFLVRLSTTVDKNIMYLVNAKGSTPPPYYLYLKEQKTFNNSIQPIATLRLISGVAAALRATATAELSYSFINRLRII